MDLRSTGKFFKGPPGLSHEHEVSPRAGEAQCSLDGILVIYKDMDVGWLADSATSELILNEGEGLGERPKLFLIVCGVWCMLREKKVLREGRAAGKQIVTGPARTRVPQGRAIRKGNKGLTGDFRKILQEFFLLCTFVSLFPPFFMKNGLIGSKKIVGDFSACPLGGGMLEEGVEEESASTPDCQGKD